jgi:hypothetical protein
LISSDQPEVDLFVLRGLRMGQTPGDFRPITHVV